MVGGEGYMLNFRTVLCLLSILGLGAGCVASDGDTEVAAGAVETTSAPVEGDAAVWDLESGASIDASSVEFTALVSRLDCNGGVTGVVFAPTVEFADSEVVITFAVEPSAGGGCPDNDQVLYRVQLDEPIGDRALVDGACLPGADAATTAFCSNGSSRWTPQDG